MKLKDIIKSVEDNPNPEKHWKIGIKLYLDAIEEEQERK